MRNLFTRGTSEETKCPIPPFLAVVPTKKSFVDNFGIKTYIGCPLRGKQNVRVYLN